MTTGRPSDLTWRFLSKPTVNLIFRLSTPSLSLSPDVSAAVAKFDWTLTSALLAPHRKPFDDADADAMLMMIIPWARSHNLGNPKKKHTHITSPKDMVPDIMARSFALEGYHVVPGSDSGGRIMYVHTVSMYVCMYVCMSDPWLVFSPLPWCGGSIGRGAWPSCPPQQNNGRMAHHDMRQGVASKTNKVAE